MASEDEEDDEKSQSLLDGPSEVIVVPHQNSKETKDETPAPRESSKIVTFLETIPLSGQMLTFICSIIFTTVASIIKVLDEVINN